MQQFDLDTWLDLTYTGDELIEPVYDEGYEINDIMRDNIISEYEWQYERDYS